MSKIGVHAASFPRPTRNRFVGEGCGIEWGGGGILWGGGGRYLSLFSSSIIQRWKFNINEISQISLKLEILCVNVRKQQDCHRLWQGLCLRLPSSLFHLVRVSSATPPQGNLS